jgi:hypothetical protein
MDEFQNELESMSNETEDDNIVSFLSSLGIDMSKGIDGDDEEDDDELDGIRRN